MFDYTREHENDFSFWYPKIKDCGIPTPLTFYTKLPSAEKEPEYAKRLYEALKNALSRFTLRLIFVARCIWRSASSRS